MKPLTALLPLLLMSFSSSTFAAALPPAENNSEIIRVETVGMEALGYDALASMAPHSDERFERIVAHAANGRYLVAVRSNIGIIRMKGAFLDSALTVEDGNFAFYYANGHMESKGQYVHGNKAGTWMRYALDGSIMAERNYTGLNTEELLASGIAKSGTVETPVAQPATRRTSAPVQF